MKKILCVLLGLSGLIGCSEKEENLADPQLITFNNFEGMAGWAGDMPSLTTERAHSGKYAVKVDQGTEYSLTYINQLGKISTKKPKKVMIEAWVFCTEKNQDASLTLTVNNETGASFYDAIALKDVVKESKEWVKVSKEITMPDALQFSDIVKFYLWRANSTVPVYMDDVKISIIE